MIQKLQECLFTGFFTGYAPAAPGTAGTAAGMIIYILANILAGGHIHWGFHLTWILIMFWPSVLICDAGENFFGVKDPAPVVWDEVMGYWVTMLFVPYSWKLAAAGFVLFRIMDIAKPFPVYQLQSLKGGLGILIDDIAAGIYACLVLHLLMFILKTAGINIL